MATAAALPDAPLTAQLFDQPLVLWRNAQGRPTALVDRYPHRGARLSLGRVHEGLLECPYHGWRFEPGGACTAIPALPDLTPPTGHRVCAWKLRQDHGLLWAAPSDAHDAAPFAPPELAALPARQVVCGPYDVATSAPRVVENFLETAHFGFVHTGYVGNRSHTTVAHYRVEHDIHGRPGVPTYRAWQPRASSAAQRGTWVDYRYQLLGPASALLTKQAEGGLPLEAYALWACPLSDESCRVWFTLFADDTSRSDDALRAFQDSIFRQDHPVLESQRPRQLPAMDHELHCAADRLSVAYRRLLLAAGLTWGVFPP